MGPFFAVHQMTRSHSVPLRENGMEWCMQRGRLEWVLLHFPNPLISLILFQVVYFLNLGFFPLFRWLNKNNVLQENTVFIDTKRIGIIKKKVRKLEDQLDYESRRWDIKLPVCRIQLLMRSDFPLVTVQVVERRDDEPEAEGHWCSNGSQAPPGGETEGWSQREEGEGAAVGDEGEQHHTSRSVLSSHSLLPWYLPSRLLCLRFNMTTVVTACVFAAFPWRWGVLGVRWASIKAVSLSEAMRRLHKLFHTHIHTCAHKEMHTQESS